MEFSRCARAGAHREPPPNADGLSKLNSVNDIEVDVLLGDLVYRTEIDPSNGPGASGVRAPDSLERR